MTFKEYFVKHRWLWLTVLGFFLLFHGAFLFSSSIGIDSEININNPLNSTYYSVGRYGYIILSNILDNYQLNPLFASISCIPFLVLCVVLYSFLFYKVTDKDNCIAILLSSLVLYSSTIWPTILYFREQILEISIGFCLVWISLIYSYLYSINNNIKCLIFSFLLNILSFGIYQSLAMIYVFGAEAIFFLYYFFKYKKSDKKADLLIFILKFVLIFLISYLISSKITDIFTTSNYLTDQYRWGSTSITKILTSIFNSMLYVELGTNIYYTKFFTILETIFCLLVLIKGYQKSKENDYYWLIVLALISICLSPFYLTIYAGKMFPVRTQFVYPYLLGFFVYFISLFIDYKQKNIKVICFTLLCVCTIYIQYHNTEKLYYTDRVTYASDVRVATIISSDINKFQNDDYSTPVIFVGVHEAELNNSCVDGEEKFGVSWFETRYDDGAYESNKRIIGFFNALGLPYKMVDEDTLNKVTKLVEDSVQYPKEGYVQLIDEVIVVRLNDYKE